MGLTGIFADRAGAGASSRRSTGGIRAINLPQRHALRSCRTSPAAQSLPPGSPARRKRRLSIRSHHACGPAAATVPPSPHRCRGQRTRAWLPPIRLLRAAGACPRSGSPAPPGRLAATSRNEWLTNPRRTFMFIRCKALPDAPYGTLGRGGTVPQGPRIVQDYRLTVVCQSVHCMNRGRLLSRENGTSACWRRQKGGLHR